jgi:hypothetical protein
VCRCRSMRYQFIFFFGGPVRDLGTVINHLLSLCLRVHHIGWKVAAVPRLRLQPDYDALLAGFAKMSIGSRRRRSVLSKSLSKLTSVKLYMRATTY